MAFEFFPKIGRTCSGLGKSSLVFVVIVSLFASGFAITDPKRDAAIAEHKRQSHREPGLPWFPRDESSQPARLDDLPVELEPPRYETNSEESTGGPYRPDFPDEEKKPECPAGFTGLLPHPETCLKFLQCVSGGTFIMDCGPGTAFNPEISVCDWPYKVPACAKGGQGGQHHHHHHYHHHHHHRAEDDPRLQDGQVAPTSRPRPPTENTFHEPTIPRTPPPSATFHWQNQPSRYDENGSSSRNDQYPPTYNPSAHPPAYNRPSVHPPAYNPPSVHPPAYNPSVHPPTYNPSVHPPVYNPSVQPPPYNPSVHPPVYNPSVHPPAYNPSVHPPAYNPSAHPPVYDPSVHPPAYNPSVHPPAYNPSVHPPGYNPSEHPPNPGNDEPWGWPQETNLHPTIHHARGMDKPLDTERNDDHPDIDIRGNYDDPGRLEGSRRYEPRGYTPVLIVTKINGTDIQGHYIIREDGPLNETHLRPTNNNGVGGAGLMFNNRSRSIRPPGYEPTNHWSPSRQPDYNENPTWKPSNWISSTRKPILQYPPIEITYRPRQFTSTESPYAELPTVSIEETGQNFDPVVEPPGNYDIEVLETESWKPRLVPTNRTRPKVDSVIMKIERKKAKKLEAKPSNALLSESWNQPEPPFPRYYVASVIPIGRSSQPMKAKTRTPAGGQVLRLRGGSSPRDGYLEVQGAHPGWGIVCDAKDGWSLKEANVVCRQLGYTRGAEMAWQGRFKDSVSGDDDRPVWIASTGVSCSGNESLFQKCRFVHTGECQVESDAVGVRCAANRLAHCKEDEVGHNGRCYHLSGPESGLNREEARTHCTSRGADLIAITTQAENNFISEWMTQSYPDVKSIMTSGIGYRLYNMSMWLWDNSEHHFRFHKWWPRWMNERKSSEWPETSSRPICVVMKREFPCHDNVDANCTTDYFFWDTEDCASSSKGHSYICERAYDDIGCYSGKGEDYSGNASITFTGKKCLPWNKPSFSRVLRFSVPNSRTREELMRHEHCRNPNPLREEGPWCFTNLYGEKEGCDIPECEEIGMPRSVAMSKCEQKDFECMPGECIPSSWLCDGDQDCTNGLDERGCSSRLRFFKTTERHRLHGHDAEKWVNTGLEGCALKCKEADFTCRSFSHMPRESICLLSFENIGTSGAVIPDAEYNYYEMTARSIDCDDKYTCSNGKCVNQTQVCDGKNDCGDRSDENVCSVEKLDYGIRLSGTNETHKGRLEVKVFGHWGQVCDDSFGMIDADVACRELGFDFGALEITPGGYFGNMDPPNRFIIDELKCRGNETSLRDCDFDGWGVHNCRPEEAIGIVCKVAEDSCELGQWKCDNSPQCIRTTFICDQVEDCSDKSDESPEHCEAPFELRLANGSSPLEGRVEVRHHGIWGTVCDDDFSNAAAGVICRSLGYGGSAVAKKNGFFGPGNGPIWLDEVFCQGNEKQLYKCEHNHWGRHNCDHSEDAGVVCLEGPIDGSESNMNGTKASSDWKIEDLLPRDCGRRSKSFEEGEIGSEMFERVVRGSVAPHGSYPWQASLRVRGHSRSTHWCGAVILSPLHVLTAAHCLEGYNKGTYFIRAGDYHSEVDEGTEMEANIEDYYIHEDFGRGQRMINDIALVLLKGRGIPLGDNIRPICLPPANVEYSPGLNCTISGFGSIGPTAEQSFSLRYGWVPLIDQSVCRADYVYGSEKITDGMICAGFLDEGVDSCDGDSGGPLACLHNGAFTLYGITSWGHHCGQSNKPGVYVRVGHYRDWIDRKIRASVSGE